MTIWGAICALCWTVLTVAAFRLGLADGLSAACYRTLVGGKRAQETADEALLRQIDAYGGKERHGEQR